MANHKIPIRRKIEFYIDDLHQIFELRAEKDAYIEVSGDIPEIVTKDFDKPSLFVGVGGIMTPEREQTVMTPSGPQIVQIPPRPQQFEFPMPGVTTLADAARRFVEFATKEAERQHEEERRESQPGITIASSADLQAINAVSKGIITS